MTPDRFRQLETVFSSVVELPRGERATALDRLCGIETGLRREVEGLLDAHEQALAGEPATESFGGETAQPGVVGAYRLIEKMGEGGMGEVYRASRADGAFDRQVAVKVMRAALVGTAARRFARERQILADLDHPHIVRMLDGGVTPAGLAYVVMEHVHGVPITQYCEDRHLSLSERLRLMQSVCQAVTHAHQRAIVHRDLKPANVLVSDDGTPKLLDFGVAKLASEGDLPGITQGLLPAPLTPNYASPEQLRGAVVTTSADVYALGVMLYEIVCGVRPYETQGAALDEVLRLVTQLRPLPPSLAVGARTIGRPPYGQPQLRGDVDAVVMKALAKETGDRYGSVQELSDELERILRRRPVQAVPPSPLYVFRRFAARNRTLVGSVAAAALVIVVSLGLALWQWQAARRQQRLAELRFNEVRQLANKVLFDYQPALRVSRGPSDLSARMAADSLAYLDALSDERLGDSNLQTDLAAGYLEIAAVQGSTRANNIGDGPGALQSLAKAETILQRLIETGTASQRALDLHARFGCVASRIDVQRAAEHARRCVVALEPRTRSLPGNHTLRLSLGDAYNYLAEAGSVEYAARAVAVFQPVVDDAKVGGRARMSLALAHRLIGWNALNRGQPGEALAAGEAALGAMAPVIDAERNRTLAEHSFTLQLIGRSLMAEGHVDQASSALNQSIALMHEAYRLNPNDAFVQDRLLRAYLTAAEGAEGRAPRLAGNWYRTAVGLMPSLTLHQESLNTEAVRRSLHAGHARFDFTTLTP